MSLAHALLPEFDIEMAGTRKALAAVPEADAAWKPHEKSFSLGNLALHIKNLTSWVNYTLAQDELDLNQPWPPQHFRTTDLLLEEFDAAVISARALLAGADDAALLAPWTLRKGEHVIFTMPRIAVLRSFVFNHAIHHRGQLTVYLRQLDVPVPGLYGPSADEG